MSQGNGKRPGPRRPPANRRLIVPDKPQLSKPAEAATSDQIRAEMDRYHKTRQELRGFLEHHQAPQNAAAWQAVLPTVQAIRRYFESKDIPPMTGMLALANFLQVVIQVHIDGGAALLEGRGETWTPPSDSATNAQSAGGKTPTPESETTPDGAGDADGKGQEPSL